ncbi:MAG: hypothetical protein ACKOSS_05660 [Planctomycetia bacterium]
MNVLLMAASIDLGTLALVLVAVVALVVLVLRGLAASRGSAEGPAAASPAGAPPERLVLLGEEVHVDGAVQPGEGMDAGGAGEEALPAVRVEQDWRALDDPDREVEGAAGGPLPPVDVLVARLRGGDARTCERAIDDLVRHGPAAVPALQAALADADPDLRVDARRALDRIAGA